MVPKVLVIAFVNYAVGKKRLTLRRSVTAGPSSAPVTIPVRETLVGGVTRNHALWRNLVPGEGWLVRAQFLPASGAAVNIRDRCSAVGGDPCLQVRVRTAGLPAGAGTIRLVVDVEDGFRNGRTYGGTNLMIIATRANWQAPPPQPRWRRSSTSSGIISGSCPTVRTWTEDRINTPATGMPGLIAALGRASRQPKRPIRTSCTGGFLARA